MPVLEFTDEDGTLWRAWDIRPEAIHPQTRAEDYLSDCYVVGWIVFETTSGSEKRRLCPWPARWANESIDGLRALLAKAERVPPLKLDAQRQVRGIDANDQPVIDIPPDQDKPDVTDLNVVRSFRYPGGRWWTICVIQYPEDGGAPALRFTAGARSIDLRPWPKDWADARDDRLIEMLRRALPRQRHEPHAKYARRWDDAPRH